MLSSLKGGNRLLVEKFTDVCVLRAEIVNFADLSGHADSADCILALNRIYSTFDSLVDKYRVHKVCLRDWWFRTSTGSTRFVLGIGGSGELPGL